MDASYQVVDSIANVVIFLAVIPALWVSGRIILRNPMSDNRSIRLFLWLVQGGFFLIPLIDWISILRSIISLAVSPAENLVEFPLFLGTTTWLVYTAIYIPMTIVVYSFAIYYGKMIVARYVLNRINQLSLSALEQAFIVLGIAGLFNRMIQGLVINFLWILNTGSTRTVTLGYWGTILGWVLAFLILVFVIVLMNQKLDNESL